MKLKYVGPVPTLVQVSKNKPKIPVKPKGVFECDEKIGLRLLNYRGFFVKVVTKAEQKEQKELDDRIAENLEAEKEKYQKMIDRIVEVRENLQTEYHFREEEILKKNDNEVISLDKEMRGKKLEIQAKLVETFGLTEKEVTDVFFDDLKQMLKTFSEGLHIVTEQDLIDNPELAEQGAEVGDEIAIPMEADERKAFISKMFKKKTVKKEVKKTVKKAAPKKVAKPKKSSSKKKK